MQPRLDEFLDFAEFRAAPSQQERDVVAENLADVGCVSFKYLPTQKLLQV